MMIHKNRKKRDASKDYVSNDVFLRATDGNHPPAMRMAIPPRFGEPFTKCVAFLCGEN